MSRRTLKAAVGATVAAVACAGAAGATVASGAPSQHAAKHLSIALVTGDNHDPFYVTMNEGAQAEAKRLGVSVTWQGPQTFEAQPQITILDGVLARKPDALLVAPTDVHALIAPIQRFDQAHIPVITVDTDVANRSVRLGNITSNNQQGGALAAQFLARAGGGKVAYVGEQRGVFTTDERERGFEAALKKLHALKYVGPQFGADDPNRAASITEALLSRNPDLKGIFASDTAYGQGAATAVQGAGKAGKVKIVAFDAEPNEVSAVKRGLIQALIVQKAYDMGVMAVRYAVNHVRSGAKVPAETHPTYVIATKANLNSPGVRRYLYHEK